MSSAYGYTQVANIEWRQSTPFNRQYQDIYYNAEQGYNEAEQVFIKGNDLPNRFRQEARYWLIAETGFGTGLNFLVTWLNWQKKAKPSSKLRYIAFDSSPLSNRQIAKALSSFPQVSCYLDRLIEHLPPLIQGSYMIEFSDDVELIIHYHRVQDILPRLSFSAHAWYLDGFAPSRNPDIWTSTICQQIARCSAPDASIATYSVAAPVRKALTQCGFFVNKVTGFGRKKHMLTGSLKKTSLDKASNNIGSSSIIKKVAVVGAGFAGCITAFLLQKQGWQVDLFDTANAPATRASANRSAVLHYKPEPLQSTQGQFKWACYIYALSLYHHAFIDFFKTKPIIFAPQDIRGKKWIKRWQEAYRSRAIQGYFLLSSTQRVAIDFPKAGTVDLAGLCCALLEQQGIKFIGNYEITSIEAGRQGYLLNGGDSQYQHIVLTVNQGIQSTLNQWKLAVHSHKGQIDYFLPRNDHHAQAVYCSSAFLNKSDKDWQTGGSFHKNCTDTIAHEDIRDATLGRLSKDFPDLSLPKKHLHSWCDIRTASSDHLPIVGRLAKNLNNPSSGIYANLAHGGKGSLTIPLCSQLLVDLVTNQTYLPYSSLLSPSRFNKAVIKS